MDSLLILEILFILFTLVLLVLNLSKRISTKKEGTYTIIRNFNASFFTTGIICIVFIVYIFMYTKDFTSITKYLAILLLILLFVTTYFNSNLLFGHDTFLYMFSKKSYKEIRKASVLNKGNGRVISFLFKNGSKLSITTSKNNGSIMLEILKRKSVKVDYIR
ncbi:hypothetical protein [uncultured Clostridium sp.]|uniref:hypothetical protein n=1 Tax=uncultured Clostridium sp. TaxID=59620 RepID=UPI00262E6BE7|nr:hypothetical protein [uncultured Clostridium sp.]